MDESARVSQLEFGKGSQLWEYWTKGKGFALWSGAVHKWTALHRELIKAGVPRHMADGLTTNIIDAVFPGYMKQAHAKGHRNMASATYFTRAYPLEDISIRSGGDGRTVEAYAAVFNTPTEIHDRDGHYSEVIAPSAFDKTIAERGRKFGVLFNHGLTIHGTPSDRHSMPIGTPVEVRSDSRGVYTLTQYHKTPLADEVLEGIRSGAITGQSFSGRMIQSNPRGPYRPTRSGELPTVTRSEIALREYGPTPFPAYEDASIMGVRALLEAYRLGGVSLAGEPYEPDPGGGGLPDEPAEGTPEDDAEDAKLMKLLAGLSDAECMELAEMAEQMHADGSARAHLGWDALVAELAAKGAADPEGLARYIGRKKYGKAGFAALQAAGRHKHGRSAPVALGDPAALQRAEPPQQTDTPAEGAVTAEPEPTPGHHSGPVRKRSEALHTLITEGMVLR